MACAGSAPSRPMRDEPGPRNQVCLRPELWLSAHLTDLRGLLWQFGKRGVENITTW